MSKLDELRVRYATQTPTLEECLEFGKAYLAETGDIPARDVYYLGLRYPMMSEKILAWRGLEKLRDDHFAKRGEQPPKRTDRYLY